MNKMIELFVLDIVEDRLDDLRDRLRRTRWSKRETVDDWSQGVPFDRIQALCGYRLDRYDWRRAEAMLNGFGQFAPRPTASASTSSTSVRPSPTRCRWS